MLPGVEFPDGNRRADIGNGITTGHLHDPVRLRKRQRLQQNEVDYRGSVSVGSDTESQGCDGDRREAATPAEDAQSMP